jgi:signal transduction histidine kinase
LKLRIRQRMLAGFLLMSCLMIILCIFAIFFSNHMNQLVHKILEENVPSLKAAEELEIALLDMKGFTANYLLDEDEKWLDMFLIKKSTFMDWLTEARQRIHTDQEKILLNEIHQFFARYIDFQNEVIQYANQKDRKKAYRILTAEMREAFDTIYNKCEELIAINENAMLRTSLLIEKKNRILNQTMYFIGIMGILWGIGIGLFLARSITRPLYELVLKVKSATHGEFIEKVDIPDETELELLGTHVKKLIDKIHETNWNLERSRKALIQSEKLASLGKIAAGFAHEIRNPLTAIKMILYSLQKEIPQSTETKKDFFVIFKEMHRMENFLEDFLEFSKPPKPNFRSIQIRQVLNQTLNLMDSQIKKKKIRLITKFETDLPALFADEDQLKQVFINIILNAIQSMEKGDKLTIRTSKVRAIDSDREMMQIDIQDTGTGITPEMLDKIFDPFITNKEDGTGLGLFIVYQIVYNHGGYIEAVNNPDRGATFSIKLPIKKGETA